jgi:hypothetical protein
MSNAPVPPPAPPPGPTIDEAERAPGPSGAVLRGAEVDFAAAVARRRAGEDVVEAVNYFTPELMDRLNSPHDAIADAADAEWDRRLEKYERELRQIESQLPEHVRAFNSLLLHDARVLSLARQGDRLIMVMRKDIPPRDVVTITYTLDAEPFLDREALPPAHRSRVMDYLYNEFDLEREGDATGYTESILFSNGWELRLRFRDVQVTLAEPIYTLSAWPAAAAAPQAG